MSVFCSENDARRAWRGAKALIGLAIWLSVGPLTPAFGEAPHEGTWSGIRRGVDPVSNFNGMPVTSERLRLENFAMEQNQANHPQWQAPTLCSSNATGERCCADALLPRDAISEQTLPSLTSEVRRCVIAHEKPCKDVGGTFIERLAAPQFFDTVVPSGREGTVMMTYIAIDVNPRESCSISNYAAPKPGESARAPDGLGMGIRAREGSVMP